MRASTPPPVGAGLVSIDAQNEHFVAAYKQLLTPEQYARGAQPAPPPDSRATRLSSGSASRSAPPRCARHRRTRRCAGCRSSSSPTPGASEPVRIPAELADRGARASVSGLAGQAGRARTGRPPRDRHQERALHATRPARLPDPRDPPRGRSGAQPLRDTRGRDPRRCVTTSIGHRRTSATRWPASATALLPSCEGRRQRATNSSPPPWTAADAPPLHGEQ